MDEPWFSSPTCSTASRAAGRRCLALSLSGGALLTLIGAGVARPGDGATASEGSAPPAPVGPPGRRGAHAGEPGVPTLPKTGGPVQVEAALALLVLLAGFTLRRLSQAAVARA